MKLLANAVAYLAVTSFAVLPNIAMSAEPAGGRGSPALLVRRVALLARAVPRVAQQELVVQEPVVRAGGSQQQAEQQQAERPLQGLPRQRPAV